MLFSSDNYIWSEYSRHITSLFGYLSWRRTQAQHSRMAVI